VVQRAARTQPAASSTRSRWASPVSNGRTPSPVDQLHGGAAAGSRGLPPMPRNSGLLNRLGGGLGRRSSRIIRTCGRSSASRSLRSGPRFSPTSSSGAVGDRPPADTDASCRVGRRASACRSRHPDSSAAGQLVARQRAHCGVHQHRRDSKGTAALGEQPNGKRVNRRRPEEAVGLGAET